MLIEKESYLYVYTITRDYGFAPNPFHGMCTLATCKPDVRAGAKVGDWILGVGGKNMGNASQKCILLMKVTEKIGFQEYWDNPRFSIKKPLRNGSSVRMVGDNIYHKDVNGDWIQEDSHHSNPDGTINLLNLKRDTNRSDRVLISDYFLYFGTAAIKVDLDSIEYQRGRRKHKKVKLTEFNNGGQLISSIVNTHYKNLNRVNSDPCQFKNSHKRVDQATSKIS
ncbi:MAG: Nmad2 family putative nucleotide modification protein [Methylobacter sp.]